jgi:hypothetical protein
MIPSQGTVATLQFVSQLFVLLVARCGGRGALRERLQKALALRQVASSEEQVSALGLLEKQLASHRKELDIVQQNLARATTDAAYKAVEAEFARLNQEVRELEFKLSREEAAGVSS